MVNNVLTETARCIQNVRFSRLSGKRMERKTTLLTQQWEMEKLRWKARNVCPTRVGGFSLHS